MTIGESIRKARERKGITAEQLAKKAGINKMTIYKWESNLNYPNVFTLICVADVLGISLDELVGRKVKEDGCK